MISLKTGKFRIPSQSKVHTAPPILDQDIVRALRKGARNLKVVQITYVDSRGVSSIRITEPYEIKEGKYWAYCQTARGMRQFNIVNISTADVLDISYRPQYPVKIV